MKKTRLKRSSYDGQEETCTALWDFARDVIALGEKQSFSDRRVENVNGKEYSIGTRPCSTEQLAAVRKAMERISMGYGYRLLEIQ